MGHSCWQRALSSGFLFKCKRKSKWLRQTNDRSFDLSSPLAPCWPELSTNKRRIQSEKTICLNRVFGLFSELKWFGDSCSPQSVGSKCNFFFCGLDHPSYSWKLQFMCCQWRAALRNRDLAEREESRITVRLFCVSSANWAQLLQEDTRCSAVGTVWCLQLFSLLFYYSQTSDYL